MKKDFLQMASSVILGNLMGAMLLEQANEVIELAYYAMLLVCAILFIYPPKFDKIETIFDEIGEDEDDE